MLEALVILIGLGLALAPSAFLVVQWAKQKWQIEDLNKQLIAMEQKWQEDLQRVVDEILSAERMQKELEEDVKRQEAALLSDVSRKWGGY